MRTARFTTVLCLFVLACNNREASQNNPSQQARENAGQLPASKEPAVKKPDHKAPERKATVTAIAARMYNEYGDNEATADGKYLDKVVQIRGWIVEVKKDKGSYFAGFTALASGQACIFCRIRPEAVKDFAGLELKIKNGVVPEYTVEGVCKGRKAYRQVFTGYAVTLDDCILVKGQEARR